MTRLRMIPWAVGVCLVAASAAGANKLLHPPDATPGAPKGSGPALPGGVVVLGTVDSETPPVPVGPPALAAVATVAKVFVRDGQDVKPGDPLVQFDDWSFRAKVEQAKAELAAAEQDVAKAAVQKQVLAVNVERQRAAIAAADADVTEGQNAYRIAVSLFDTVLAAEKDFGTGAKLSEAQKEQRRRENLDLRRAAFLVTQARVKADDERKKMEALLLTPVDADEKMAAAKVARLKATVAEAEAAVAACVVKARDGVAGVAEQVTAAPGMTYGPSTRSPLLWVVPAGPRVVRAEVEAEFASKVADKVGQKVTVYDHNNFALVYDGEVRRVGSAFLPKRSAGEGLTVNPTRVLECVVEVSDPSPSGKPPLRVGQPVRVSFP